MEIDRLVALRPWSYHLTSDGNLAGIRSTRLLRPAATLVKLAGREELLGVRRPEHIVLEIEGTAVVIRDQYPLHEGNMRLDPGWSLARLIEHINSHVFFWPGTDRGPISYGLRHYERYSVERPKIIRVPTSDLFTQPNRGIARVCRFNSGAPRWSRGVAAPRGASTFVPLAEAEFRPGEVVEIVFFGDVRLPQSAELGPSPKGPWRHFF